MAKDGIRDADNFSFALGVNHYIMNDGELLINGHEYDATTEQPLYALVRYIAVTEGHYDCLEMLPLVDTWGDDLEDEPT